MVNPMTNGTGGNPVYNPSAPTGGGPATNYMAGAAGSYGAPQSSPVWVGSQRGGRPNRDRDGDGNLMMGGPKPTGRNASQDIWLTETQLLSAFDQFSRKDYLRFRNLLIAAGLVSEDADAPTVRSAYASLIGETMEMQAGGVKMSPMQLVKNLIRMNGLEPGKIGDGEDYGSAVESATPKSQKTTATSVYDLTPEDARMTLEQAVQQKLGRAPTEEELEDFISAAQTRARNNPTTVTQEFQPGRVLEGGNVETQHEDGQLVGSTRTTTTPGFDGNQLSQMALDRAEEAPDYASYQAVSRFFPALVNALGATA